MIKAARLSAILFPDQFWLRAACFAACLSSCGALLLKVYGVLPMQTTILYLYIPCVLFLAAVWLTAPNRSYSGVGEALGLGALAGLMATFAYDLARAPFMLAGQRVFMTNDTYGVWIADAAASTRITDALGWAYHFSNGITFGIMYAIYMRGQHVVWAVLYALMLETVNLSTPFTKIFSLSGNWLAIAILYLGHVAYGIPLGLITRHWDRSVESIRTVPVWGGSTALVVGFTCLVAGMFSADRTARDGRISARALTVEFPRLNPDFIRLNKGDNLTIHNPGSDEVVVVDNTEGRTWKIAAETSVVAAMLAPGIFQLFVKTNERSISSFAIVEPAEETLHRNR